MKMVTTKTVIDLMEKFKDDEDVIFLIQDTVNCCAEYTNAVVKHVTSANVNNYIPSKERAGEMANFDRARRLAHEALISTVTSLNRFLRAEGLDVFYDGDESDRYAIADFAVVVTEMVAKEEIQKYTKNI